MTAYEENKKARAAHVEIDDSSTDEEPRKGFIRPFATARKKQPRLPVIIYTPPAGIDFIQKHGFWVFGSPVWDQESAKRALENLHQMLRDYLYGSDIFSGNINLEKLFEVSNRCDDLMSLLEIPKNKI